MSRLSASVNAKRRVWFGRLIEEEQCQEEQLSARRQDFRWLARRAQLSHAQNAVIQ
tara:strand:- start:65 stop:232 length:168 start_codon:yes stop_codon:yes gene_type:complete